MTNNDPNTPAEWRPPPDFVPVSSALPGVQVYAPAPDEPEPERRQFKCPRCGASTSYSAGEAALACAHCGHVETPDAPVVGRAAQQAEFTVETMNQEARGWGQVRREIHCESCGADIVLEPGDLTAACPFCASQRVITRQEARQIRRPTHLIPFQVDPQGGARQLQDWLAEGWMHPPGLRQAAASARLNGVYLPFWIFSARLSTSWQAEVGHKRKRTTWDGKKKTEIKWKKESGRLNLKVSDMLTPGSNKVSAPLLQRLYPFELSALTVYDPAYLAGWQAQVYDVGLRPAWDQARNWMRQQAKAAIHRQINLRHGRNSSVRNSSVRNSSVRNSSVRNSSVRNSSVRNSSVRNFNMTADLQDERWRYVLLPVYLSAYRFKGQTYQVMVNGQTGKAAGQKPLDWRRVGGALAGLLLPGLLLTALSTLLPQDVAGCSCMLGLMALMIGLALAWRVLQQARAVDKIA